MPRGPPSHTGSHPNAVAISDTTTIGAKMKVPAVQLSEPRVITFEVVLHMDVPRVGDGICKSAPVGGNAREIPVAVL